MNILFTGGLAGEVIRKMKQEGKCVELSFKSSRALDHNLAVRFAPVQKAFRKQQIQDRTAIAAREAITREE